MIVIPMISGQQPNNLKCVNKCLPYVNEWARSVLSLTTLYVSKLRHFIIRILQVFFSYKFQFQFGMIFIFVDAFIWHTFTKDMKPEEFWTTFKGMKNTFYLRGNPLFRDFYFIFHLNSDLKH